MTFDDLFLATMYGHVMGFLLCSFVKYLFDCTKRYCKTYDIYYIGDDAVMVAEGEFTKLK